MPPWSRGRRFAALVRPAYHAIRAPRPCGPWECQYQNCRAMVMTAQIEDLAQRIGREFHADRVVLFGSHARGMAKADSDVDLLIILPFEGKGVTQSVAMRPRPTFPVDLIVRTPEKVRERLEMDDAFIREILEEGRVLYEADHR